MNIMIKQKTRVLESLYVFFLGGIALCTLTAYFSETGNTNDFRFTGNLQLEVLSNQEMVMSETIANYMKAPLKGITVTVDAYNENEQIVGTGCYTADPGVLVGPMQSVHLPIIIIVPSGYKSVKHFVSIPRSDLGTGMLTTMAMPKQ